VEPYRSGPAVSTEAISPWAAVARPRSAPAPSRRGPTRLEDEPWRARTVALAVGCAALVAWSLFGRAGLFAAIAEQASSPSGHGWFVLGAVLFQAPATLLALPLIGLTAAFAKWSRARAVVGVSIVMIVATQIAYWVTVTSMDTGGTC
jgi:hypothetical protein